MILTLKVLAGGRYRTVDDAFSHQFVGWISHAKPRIQELIQVGKFVVRDTRHSLITPVFQRIDSIYEPIKGVAVGTADVAVGRNFSIVGGDTSVTESGKQKPPRRSNPGLLVPIFTVVFHDAVAVDVHVGGPGFPVCNFVCMNFSNILHHGIAHQGEKVGP